MVILKFKSICYICTEVLTSIELAALHSISYLIMMMMLVQSQSKSVTFVILIVILIVVPILLLMS